MSPQASPLHAAVTEVRTHLERRAWVVLALWSAVGLGLILVLAWVLAGADGWRQGANGPVVLDLVAAALLAGAVWWFRGRVEGWFAEAKLARAMEEASGVRPGWVLGSLELSRKLPRGVSSSLADAAAARTMASLHGGPRQLSGGLGAWVDRWRSRGLKAASGVAVVLALLTVAAPGRSGGAWGALMSPLATMADPVYARMVVTPGDVEVLRGTDVAVSVRAPGRTTVDLAWQAAGEVARTQSLELVGGSGVHTLRGVSAPVEYRVRAPDGAESPTYRLTPVDPLFVSSLSVAVTYPAHTGLPPEELSGDIPPLLLPAGTRLTLQGSASRPLQSASLVADSVEVVSMEVAGTGFLGDWVPRREGRFDWAFQDEDGSPAEIQPLPLEIALVQDSAPRVSIPLPGRDTLLPGNLRQPLILESRDDYGLRRLELVAYRVTAFGERHEPVVQGLDLGGTRAALARPLLDLSDWGLLPGDTVRYYAEAWDNAPAAQSTRTREFTLRMPDASELRRDAEARLEAVAERMQELADEAAREAEETRDMERKAAGERDEAQQLRGRPNQDEELGFEERQELEQALGDQEKLTSEVDSLRSELEDLQQSMAEAGQADPEMRADLEELQELLSQIADEAMRERLQELSESLEGENLDQAQDALRDLAAEQENFRDRLEESLERFRRAAVDQDFRATQSEAEELAQQERALADAMREADDPELRARQQEMLEERADELAQRMERLQERLEQIEERDAAQGVETARERAEASKERMAQAQQQAQEGQNAEAGEEADQAAQEMEEASQELQGAQQQMAQEKAEALMRAMEQAADDALSLARRQGDLREEMQGATPDQLAAMRGDQAALVQGIRNLAQNLQDGSEAALTQNRELAVQMGRAMESMERTIGSMENRRAGTPTPAAAAEQSVADLNQVALMAMATMDQMNQQAQGQPQAGDVSEQLEQLAQQQGELFNQTGQLMPLQLGEQAMQEQLEQMAQEQQSVADDLGEMSDEPGSEEEALGDLDALAEEAMALAQQMAQGRLTPEMVQRQERLFHRLLDAGRSLEREEFSDEREAERVTAFERGEVIPLTPEQMGALRYGLPDADQLQRLPPAVRQMVIQYFERINRQRAGGGGG